MCTSAGLFVALSEGVAGAIPRKVDTPTANVETRWQDNKSLAGFHKRNSHLRNVQERQENNGSQSSE